MPQLDRKTSNKSGFPAPRDDEEALNVHVDWTQEEEAKAKRKYVSLEQDFRRIGQC
jgi:hypothetical protein